jgi:hypothetical protein
MPLEAKALIRVTAWSPRPPAEGLEMTRGALYSLEEPGMAEGTEDSSEASVIDLRAFGLHATVELM